MFKKSLIAGAIALALGVNANATGNHNHNPLPDPVSEAPVATATSTSDSRSGAEASSRADSSSSSNSDSAATSSATSGDSNSSSTSGGNSISNSSTYKQQKQAPGIFTAATNTTALCQGEWHLGASVIGGGVSFGKSRTVRDCVLAEASEREFDKGNLNASIKLRCRISFYREALGEECEALLETSDGTGRTTNEASAGRPAVIRTPEQRNADRAKLLKEVGK